MAALAPAAGRPICAVPLWQRLLHRRRNGTAGFAWAETSPLIITERRRRRSPWLICVIVLQLAFGVTAHAADLGPQTIAAFNHYVQLSERRMTTETETDGFLWIDRLPAQKQNEVLLQTELWSLSDSKPSTTARPLLFPAA